MTDISLSKVLDDIIRREGGYVDHPQDKGGPTNYGVTQRTLSKWRGEKVTPEDVKKLTPGEAKRIYWNMYMKQFSFALNDQRVVDLISDSSVHHGPERTMRWLQRSLGVEADGRAGPQTIDAYRSADPSKVYERMFQQRKQLLDKLGQKQPVFNAGWQKRLEEFEDDGG